MPFRFAVLGSGSRGNAALIQGMGPALLLDVGLGPRLLAERFARIGADWGHVGAVLLTHTHSDHVQQTALWELSRRRIPLLCHEQHTAFLDQFDSFRGLARRRLVRTYDDRPFLAPNGLHVEPLAMSHDSGPTFGFRIDAKVGRPSRRVSLGVVTDTGRWDHGIVAPLADVDVLAVEFNHDVELQRRSSRPRSLIERNLGPFGHLSNEQASSLLAAVLAEGARPALRHVVLLHLSEECNRPELAVAEARSVLRGVRARADVHPTFAEFPSPDLRLSPRTRRGRVPTPALPWEAA